MQARYLINNATKHLFVLTTGEPFQMHHLTDKCAVLRIAFVCHPYTPLV